MLCASLLATAALLSTVGAKGLGKRHGRFTLAAFSESMVLTAMVSIDGIEQSAGTLKVYVGDEVRGMTDSPSIPPFGPFARKSMYLVTVGANKEGETLTFKFVSAGINHDLKQTLNFVINGNKGSVLDPFILGNTDSPHILPSTGTSPQVDEPRPGRRRNWRRHKQ